MVFPLFLRRMFIFVKGINLKVSKSEVDREFLLIKAVNNSFYEDEHTTEKEWKDQIRYNILLEELLTRDIDISNKELESFYHKNKELYQFDDSYRIRHIVVKDEEEAREVVFASSMYADGMLSDASVTKPKSPPYGDVYLSVDLQTDIHHHTAEI